MKVFRKISDLQNHLNNVRTGNRLGLVPTMGALHKGHLALLNQALNDNNLVVSTIFVNPAQFNKKEDLVSYPKNEKEDLRLLEEAGCDVVFIPDAEEMYPTKPIIEFSFGSLINEMEGKYRPGHFNGVALIVSKLFNLVKPDSAYFGQKDYQQFKIISRLNQDLSFGIEIKSVPTIREKSGLAQSSRNLKLSEEAKLNAANINLVLMKAEKELLSGHRFSSFKQDLINELGGSGLEVEYFEYVSDTTFEFIDHWESKELSALCIAVTIEGIRLIDNRIF